MTKLPDIISVTDLRLKAASIIDRLKKAKQPIVITQRGRAAAVLLSINSYERSEHERDILHLLAQGELEIAHNKGFDLDHVLAEADKLLESDKR
jgi:prevent-host-death family protein